MNNRKFEWSLRLQQLPPYLFAEIDRQKAELKKNKIKFIDLSIGDPDIFAPEKVLTTLSDAAKLKENQKYSLDQGKPQFKTAIKEWFKKRFAVTLDENEEILPLLGSKEGLVHFPLGFVNSGDYVIIPSPGYPGYRGAALFSGAKIYELALREKERFLPDLESIPERVRNKAKIIYLNYPNNPTTALAPRDFLEKLIIFCAKYGIILAYDNAYSEIYFDGKPHSILEIEGAKEIAIEFHSFSKTFCMTGFRVGWAAGNRELVSGLVKVKTNVDSGIFGAVQDCAVSALEEEQEYTDNLRRIFKARRDCFIEGLKKIGMTKVFADSTFYTWVKLPGNFKSSIDFAKYLLQEKRVIVAPGVGFGKYGEGFIRFALTVDEDNLKKAIDLLK